MGTKATREQRLHALWDLSRRARSMAGYLEDSGRSGAAAAYLDLADLLVATASYVARNGWPSQPTLEMFEEPF